MTAVLEVAETAAVTTATAPGAMPSAQSAARDPRVLFATWMVTVVAGMALVMYGFGPLFLERRQTTLLRSARADIGRAANESSGLEGATVPTKPPETGAPVGILEIGAVQLQQAVVEGVGASQTRGGPAHVPGTAGLGQPGNSVVVGRRTTYGHPFSGLHKLRFGEKILVTTPQGQSVYTVKSVGTVRLRGGSGGRAADSTIDRTYGPSNDDRLTLVTSASAVPANRSRAEVVVARLEGKPFPPTPQGGRSDRGTGAHGDPGATSSVVIALVVYGALMGGGVMLFRRVRPSTAYLLTIAPSLAVTIVAAETLSRLFPAWM